MRSSFGGFRPCLLGVLDLCESWDGVAQGPRSALSNHEADWDAAGHPYEEGELEPRAETVENIKYRRRSIQILDNVDYSDSAGGPAVRFEARSLTIDDRVRFRRSKSLPPRIDGEGQTRLQKSQSLQAWGMLPCVDGENRMRKRCLSPDFGPISRSAAAKMALLTTRDISSLTHKKQFHDCPPPGSSLSPRQAALTLESMDIDAPYGRLMRPRTSSKGIIPTDGCTYDTDANRDHLAFFSGAPRNRSTGEFFKKTLEAQSYAKLLGRPGHCNSSAIKELANLSEVEVLRQLKHLQRLQKGDSRFVVDSIAEVCWAASTRRAKSEGTRTEPEQTPPRSPSAKSRRGFSKAESLFSTVASDGDLNDSRSTPLSAASRSVFFSHPEGMQEQAEVEAATERKEDAPDSAPYSFLADQEEPDSEPPSLHWRPLNQKVPLGLRRVLSSVLPSTDNIPEDVLSELGMNVGALSPTNETPTVRKLDLPRATGTSALRTMQRFPLRKKLLAKPDNRHKAVRPSPEPEP